MTSKFTFSAAALILLAGIRLGAQTAPIDRMEASTVRVFAINGDQVGTGSGFIIGDGSYVVTNHHVIAGASRVGVAGKDLKIPVRQIVADNEGKDIAILQLERNSGRPGVTLALRSSVQKTQNVFAAGFPAAGDEQGKGENWNNMVEVKFSQGIISGFVTGNNGQALYQISAALNPGNSGGPLFDTCGRVIGIDSMKSLKAAVVMGQDGKPTVERLPYGEGVAWAIEADELVTMMQTTSISPVVETASCQARTTQTAMPVVTGTETARTAVTQTTGGGLSTQITIVIGAAGLALLGLMFLMFRSRQQPAYPAVSPVPPPPVIHMPETLPMYQPPAYIPTAARTFVKCLAGTQAGMEFDLSSAPTTMGRDPRLSQIVFDSSDPVVSKRHCVLHKDPAGGAILLEDCGSTNGTFLESGERLRAGEQRRLTSQSRFYLGDRNHLFQVG